MATESPKNPLQAKIGIVGGGLGALAAFVTLRFRGVSAENILIFAPETSPERNWAAFVTNIKQRGMRSESAGHFYPTDSPGLATVEAVQQRSLTPLVRSWFDRYHPTVDFMLGHIRQIAKLVGYYQSLHQHRVSDIRREPQSFAIISEGGQCLARVSHLILAIGHGQIHVPQPVADYRKAHPTSPNVVHAFASHKVPSGKKVLVVGDGLTAATEWSALLKAGNEVIAVSRNGFASVRPLNTPRMYFSKRGFGAYRNLPDEKRLAALRTATSGSLPRYPFYQDVFMKNKRAGRLQEVTGELTEILNTVGGTLQCRVVSPDGKEHQIETDAVIAATGFMPPSTHPLLKKLIERHGLPTLEGILKCADTLSIPQLSTFNSSLFVLGAACAWALPCADSIGGLKIGARTIADAILGEESWAAGELVQKTRRWSRLVRNKAL